METELSLGLALSALSNHVRMAGTTPMPVGAAKLVLFDSECVAHDDWDTRAKVTRAAEYNRHSEATRSIVSYDWDGVTGCALQGGQAGTVRQRH